MSAEVIVSRRYQKVDDEILVEARYYNANRYACAVVAVMTPGVDWAAYMGGCGSDLSEEEAVRFVARKGCKLSEEDARHFFPDSMLIPMLIPLGLDRLPYRP